MRGERSPTELKVSYRTAIRTSRLGTPAGLARPKPEDFSEGFNRELLIPSGGSTAANHDAAGARGERLERLLSPGQVVGRPFGDLSDFFNPLLSSFAEGTLRGGGEVVVSQGPTGPDGLLLYHPPERLVSLFTRSPGAAADLLEGRNHVDVFSELLLAPESEVYHIYAADLTTWSGSHRFAHPVREARPSDRDALLSLFQELYGRADVGWFQPIPPRPERGFVVEVDGYLAGAGWVSAAGGRARLHSLSVRPRYRRLGIGRDLWYARMLWAKQHGERDALTEISEHGGASAFITTSGGMRRVGQMYRTYRP